MEREEVGKNKMVLVILQLLFSNLFMLQLYIAYLTKLSRCIRLFLFALSAICRSAVLVVYCLPCHCRVTNHFDDPDPSEVQS